MSKMSVEEFVQTSAVQLEELTAISQVQWSHYFNGRRSPSLKTIGEIAKRLDMTPGDLSTALLQRIEIHCHC